MATVYHFQNLILSPGFLADPSCCSRDEVQGHAKFRIFTKVLSKIQTSCGKKYILENSHSPAVQIIKNRHVNVGLGKAPKRCVSEISHPAE